MAAQRTDNHFISVSKRGALMARRKGQAPVEVAGPEGVVINPDAEAQARGVVLLTGQQVAIPIAEYTPMQIKQAVTGYGKADKKQIQEMVRVLLNLKSIPKPDDAADALAAAITHATVAR